MFWKNGSETSISELTLNNAFDAVIRYGELMERQGTVIFDASVLPLPKAHMKQALMMVWKNTVDEHLKAVLGGGYVNLANFQEGVGNTPVDYNLPSGFDPVKDREYLNPYLKWSMKIAGDVNSLLSEWEEFTGNKI